MNTDVEKLRESVFELLGVGVQTLAAWLDAGFDWLEDKLDNEG